MCEIKLWVRQFASLFFKIPCLIREFPVAARKGTFARPGKSVAARPPAHLKNSDSDFMTGTCIGAKIKWTTCCIYCTMRAIVSEMNLLMMNLRNV